MFTAYRCACLLLLIFLSTQALAVDVDNTAELVAAVRDGEEGSTIEIAAGTYELEAPLEPKPGMTLRGAGTSKTIITHAADWKPSTKTLPDPEMKLDGFDTYAYLVRLKDKANGITISDLTLRGPQLHGAIFGFRNGDLHLHHLRIEDTLWSGIRTFSMQNAKIHDCEFVDAGGRWKRGGTPGVDGGITGGAIFAIWMKDSQIAHNRFWRTQTGKADEFYGVKARQGKRCRIHHNTIEVNFSIELPFENDEEVEIDHNVCHGTISIPKHSGGPELTDKHSFHIHHNWCTKSYAIEFSRNAVEIDHNLFDFSIEDDGGNLISEFGKVTSPGTARMHDNLIKNPGRGRFWSNGGYNNFSFYNNHVIANTPTRDVGLFGLPKSTDFETIVIRDNIIECAESNPRPLMRSEESYAATIANNKLVNVRDTEHYENLKTDDPVGLTQPLKFECGVHGEYVVEGWDVSKTPTENEK